MVHSIRFKTGARKVSPPTPTFMDDDQLALYLKDLRNNRPPRPNGSRPLPTRESSLSTTPLHSDLPPRASSALATSRPAENPKGAVADPFPRSSSAMSYRRTIPDIDENDEISGIPEDEVYEPGKNPSDIAASTQPIGQYRVSGHRLMQKLEARSLRNALEEMDLQDEERLFNAAQEEAVGLVLQHQTHGFAEPNPHAPYQNPDHSTSRPQPDMGRYVSNGKSIAPTFPRGRSSSKTPPNATTAADAKLPLTGGVHGEAERVDRVNDNLPAKRAARVNFSLPQDDRSHTPQSRVTSKIPISDGSKSLFRNPRDRIYEEPEDPDSQNDTLTGRYLTSALTPKPRNSLQHGPRPLPDRLQGSGDVKRPSIFEIHKNVPTQSRNPLYTTNTVSSTVNPCPEQDIPPTKDGLEIRSDDIRAATSMKLKDRSSKLPMPSAVSDRPGRPIVSFDPDWKAPEKEASIVPGGIVRQDSRQSPPRPSIADTPTSSEGSIPIINVSEVPVPEISLTCDDDSQKPTVTVSELGPPISAMAPQNEQNRRALPDPRKYTQQQRNNKAAAFTRNRLANMTPTSLNSPSAACAACGLPISGRIVTACNQRLHPECFTCYHCNTPLECVAFYQEPDAKRAERLANSDENPHDCDIDSSSRFYCHLDFHELFSPRCKSCKTPIEGEVIVACGAEWHVGHFFCAECGDPFTPQTPFVEKEGYAWCVRCHSRRTADKCRGCKLPVLESVVVSALGGQWHDKCFVCCECGGGFGSEGRFFVRKGKPRVNARGRQIGGPVDMAACEKCEAMRLKA